MPEGVCLSFSRTNVLVRMTSFLQGPNVKEYSDKTDVCDES